MATFIDDARDFRSRGASRKQLVSFIKMHGVDEERAELLADRLDVELGIGPHAPGTVAAPPRVAQAAPTESNEPVIDLRDSAAFPLVAATDPTMAISRVQRLIDIGIPRHEIQDYLQRSGVLTSEAAYISQTTPRSRRGDDLHYAQPVRRRRRQNDGSAVFATLTIGIGLALLIFGLFALRDGREIEAAEPWVWFSVGGTVIALAGIKWMIDSAV